MAFPELLADIRELRTADVSRSSNLDEAADRLPLSPEREPYRRIDDDHDNVWIVKAWEASVEDAARHLSNMVVIHDNGGTASSPKKIKKAARELLRLLEQRED